jgi:hypothetical protein
MKTRIRKVRLRIRYKRRSELVALATLLTLALATTAFLGTLAWGQEEASADTQAAPAAFTGMRKYYLTRRGFQGDEVLTACAPGYHMASLWEILDPSNLKYNTDLGRTRADSGTGPPAREGWVRTGWDSEGSTYIPGQDNCFAWTTNANTALGTIVVLSFNWTAGINDIQGWTVMSAFCDKFVDVWCVEDYPTFVYLPLVLRD